MAVWRHSAVAPGIAVLPHTRREAVDLLRGRAHVQRRPGHAAAGHGGTEPCRVGDAAEGARHRLDVGSPGPAPSRAPRRERQRGHRAVPQALHRPGNRALELRAHPSALHPALDRPRRSVLPHASPAGLELQEPGDFGGAAVDESRPALEWASDALSGGGHPDLVSRRWQKRGVGEDRGDAGGQRERIGALEGGRPRDPRRQESPGSSRAQRTTDPDAAVAPRVEPRDRWRGGRASRLEAAGRHGQLRAPVQDGTRALRHQRDDGTRRVLLDWH